MTTYTRTNWVDGVAGGTPITAAALNNIESQVASNAARWSSVQEINVRDYGATGNGATDDTAALNAALAAVPAAGGRVFLPAGTYLVSGVVTIAVGSTIFAGAGRNATIILSNSTTSDVLSVGANAAFTWITGMTIKRSVTPTAGIGILFNKANSGTYSTVSDVYLRGHFRGLYATSSTYGWMTRVVSEGNVSDGFFFTNDTQGALQWQVTDCLSQGNGGDGFRVLAQTGLGSAQITMGTWTNCATFGNTGYGASFEGASACPIQDIRMVSCFLGQDGASEINLDTYGQSHLLTNIFTELTGSQGTGINLATAASGIGHGIVITANNKDTTIVGGTHKANSQSGIYNNGADTVVTGVSFRDNGQNSDAAISSNCGIYNAGGNLTATGSGFSGQNYGVYTVTDTILALGNTIRPSGGTGTAQAVVGAVTLTSSVTSPNRLLSV